ncbi:MAG: tRNA (adenosine(37)-N6)-dimethylallyltransferase MiaA [Pseudomonadota bacterium]
MSEQHTIYVIGGPTASGKSAHALELAAKHNGVIINADSMQIYDGLPILTAQPPAEDKVRAPHELYGHLHPNEACSAGNWREMVEPLIHDILEAGQAPIICGGSGLYIKALMEGLSPIPDIPDDIRNNVVQRYEELGAEDFYAELMERDPVMAKRFHVNHKARIVRAMEVLEATGRSLADWQKEPLNGPPEDWVFDVSLIIPEREKLYQRCNDRFHVMLEQGALDELRAFDQEIKDGKIQETSLLTHALGAEPLRKYLHGKRSLDDAITDSQNETRRYAKRQVTWFKHQIKPNKNIAKIETIT